jgi:uncharacterized iron-regulated protein
MNPATPNPDRAAARSARRWSTFGAACAGLCFTLCAAAEPAIYLLGEVHDNPEGHALRLEKITDIVRSASQPVIAMEQFDREKQAALSAAQQDCPDAACVIAKAGGKGWDWDFYKPVIDLALRQRIPLVAANVSPQDARLVVRDGLSAALSATVRKDFGLDVGVPAVIDAIQREAVFQGHCRMAPKAALGGMVAAQVARDVWMAHVLREHPQSTVLLLAGNGHVRKDAGVYHWLSPAERQRTQVHAYLEAPDAQDAARFDQIHPIAAVTREDPCAAFRAATGNAARP